MTTATATHTSPPGVAPAASDTTQDTPRTAAGDASVRRLRELHARAGHLIADAPHTRQLDRAVFDLAAEIRRSIAELSDRETLVPSTAGSGTPAVVRLRELGTLQRDLLQVLRRSVDPAPLQAAVKRTSVLVGVLAGTLA